MPHSTLEDEDYLNANEGAPKENDSEYIRLLSLILLTEKGYFDSDREAEELSRVVAWIAKKMQEDERLNFAFMRKIMCSFALASRRESDTAKKERLLVIFEVLLTSRTTRIRLGVQWLAIVLAYWVDRPGSELDVTLGFLCLQNPYTMLSLPATDIDHLLDILLEDLAANLASFCFAQKMSATVSNRLHRLCTDWSENRVDRTCLSYIQKAAFACQSGVGSEDAFVSLAASVLSSKQ
jgi:hypothetical protein